MGSFVKRLVAGVAAFALCSVLSAGHVYADSVPIGGQLGGSPSLGSAPAATLAASISGGSYTLVNFLGQTKGTGSYNVEVYSPDSGTGFTTIVYNLSVTSGVIEHVVLNDFASFTTDVVQTGGSGVNASNVRNLGDGTLSFDFDTPLTTGQSSRTFVIRTNAPTFTAGSISFIDGGIDTKASFGPTAVPLPSTAATGLGLIAGLSAFGGLIKLRRWLIAPGLPV